MPNYFLRSPLLFALTQSHEIPPLLKLSYNQYFDVGEGSSILLQPFKSFRKSVHFFPLNYSEWILKFSSPASIIFNPKY